MRQLWEKKKTEKKRGRDQRRETRDEKEVGRLSIKGKKTSGKETEEKEKA